MLFRSVRKGRRVRGGADSARDHLLPDPRLRQRAISRTHRWEFGSGTAGCVRRSRPKERSSPRRRQTANGGTCCPQHLDWASCQPIADNRFQLLRRTPVLRFHPAWLALFVKGGDAFACFIRFARLHMIFQRKIDISLHGMPPELFY